MAYLLGGAAILVGEQVLRGGILTWVVPDDLPFPMPVEVEVGGERHRVEMT